MNKKLDREQLLCLYIDKSKMTLLLCLHFYCLCLKYYVHI